MRFSEKVLQKVSEIPRGKVSTYKALARACGSPRAARAVGNALNSNPNLIKVPCHRVVCFDGRIGGYAFGRGKKAMLLRSEGLEIRDSRIEGLESALFRF